MVPPGVAQEEPGFWKLGFTVHLPPVTSHFLFYLDIFYFVNIHVGLKIGTYKPSLLRLRTLTQPGPLYAFPIYCAVPCC